MPETIRLLEPADQHQHARLMAHAFGKGRVVAAPDPDTSPSPSLAYTWGIFEGGRLLASCILNPFEVCWPDPGPEPGDRRLRMGGVGGVATWADQRGRGHVDRLLRQGLVAMRDSGQVVSSLYPFAFSFYRRLGWEWTGEHRRITLPLRELPRAMPSGWSVEPLEGSVADVRAVLEPLWSAHARRIRGAFPSEHHQWDGRLAHSGDRTTYPYVARDGSGTARGYLLWRYGDQDRGEVRLWVSGDADTDAALATLLRDFGMQCPEATVDVVDDHPIKARLCHHSMKVELQTDFQSRVVDIEAAVAALGRVPVPDGAARIRVSDPWAGWNDGSWELRVDGGIASARRTSSASDPDLSASIGAFSQLFHGCPSLEALVRAGQVDIREGAGLEWLRRLFPAMPVHCWDGY